MQRGPRKKRKKLRLPTSTAVLCIYNSNQSVQRLHHIRARPSLTGPLLDILRRCPRLLIAQLNCLTLDLTVIRSSLSLMPIIRLNSTIIRGNEKSRLTGSTVGCCV